MAKYDDAVYLYHGQKRLTEAFGDGDWLLTAEHANSSYGEPVLIINGADGYRASDVISGIKARELVRQCTNINADPDGYIDRFLSQP